MIYDEETQTWYRNAYHMENSKGVAKRVAYLQQHPLTREELIAQTEMLTGRKMSNE